MTEPTLTAGGEKVLETATEVFYAEGIRATGVDTVTARAGVSKPSLYAQFGSKENLVAAVLDRRRRTRQDALRAHLDHADATGSGRILAVFDWLAAGRGRSEFRGCPFTNATGGSTGAGDGARAGWPRSPSRRWWPLAVPSDPEVATRLAEHRRAH